MQFAFKKAYGDPVDVVSSVVQPRKSLQARIVSGSIVLLSGSGLNTGINLAYNIAVARYLGPKGFGHATVIYTILVLLSAMTLSFQIIATKMIAQQQSAANKRPPFIVFFIAPHGMVALPLPYCCAFQGRISNYLNLPDAKSRQSDCNRFGILCSTWRARGLHPGNMRFPEPGCQSRH